MLDFNGPIKYDDEDENEQWWAGRVKTLEAKNSALQKEADHWREAYISAHNLGAELKEKLADLRAQAWEPVSDADYRADVRTVLHIGGDGEWIGISRNDGAGVIHRESVQLPPTLRLCRTQPAPVQP